MPWSTALELLTRDGMNAGAVLNPLIGDTKGDDVDAVHPHADLPALIDNRALGDGDLDSQLWKPRGESVPDNVVLLGVDIKMFYGGPKEAIMHSIYRQNIGFTNIVIGRKHADAPYARRHADLGRFRRPGYLLQAQRRPQNQADQSRFRRLLRIAGPR